MTEETWRRLEAWRARWADGLAWPVPSEQIDAASAALGLPFPPDYREFLQRCGGGMVGAYPIFGLRISRAMSMSTALSVDMENRRYREMQWPGIADWLIISSDEGGNPIGIAPDGHVWASGRDSQSLKVAEDFEEFLNLCMELSSGFRWLMIHPAIAAAPVKPQRPLALFALSEASRFDIWHAPLMVQTLWTETLEERVLLWPLDEAGLGRSTSRKVGPKLDWRMEVRLPWVRDPVPTVTTSGALAPLDAGSPKAMLANAVQVMCKQLAWRDSRGLEGPMIIRASETSQGYGVKFERLPMVIGGHTFYHLSKDLSSYQISPGR